MAAGPDGAGGEQGHPVTIYDVAREAGVHPSTVSRAFARPGRVSSRTAMLVHEVAERLGYRQDEPFRPPGRSRTRVICLAVSDITNPYYSGIIRGAEKAAYDADFSLVVADARESAQEERRMLSRQLSVADGIVVTSSRLSDTDLRGLAREVPVVVLNRRVPGLPCVHPDNARGVRRAVEHLGALGHRRIGYVAGPDASWADGARWRALREACYELELGDARLGPVAPTLAGGRAAARSLVAQGLTAAVAYNDLVGVGLVRGLVELGLAVPEDVSVVGFDNTLVAELSTPGLTTVAQPVTLLGETAARSVIAQVRGDAVSRERVQVMPVRLVERASTGPVRSG